MLEGGETTAVVAADASAPSPSYTHTDFHQSKIKASFHPHDLLEPQVPEYRVAFGLCSIIESSLNMQPRSWRKPCSG